jgi:hypothetical protein
MLEIIRIPATVPCSSFFVKFHYLRAIICIRSIISIKL